jgi:hypothetical protein
MRPDAATDPRTGARVVLGAGILFGVALLGYMAATRLDLLGVNFRVYRVAAGAALAGENLYAVTPEGLPAYRYLYPPVTVLAFVPFALVSWHVGFALHALVTVGIGVATAVLLVRVVESQGVRLTRLDRALVVGWVVLGVHAVPSLFFGQVNHHLLALLALGFVALERGDGWTSGAAFALATLVKLFPALVGVWLVRRRDRRAVGAATATGLAGLLVGVLAFGVDAHRAYVVEALVPRQKHTLFAGGLDPGATYVTLRRPLSHLLPTIDPALYGPLAVAVLVPIVGYLYLDVDGYVDRLVAIFGTVAAMVLVVPSLLLYVLYLTFPLVPLLYLLEGRRARRLFVAGALVAGVPFTGERVLEVVAVAPVPEGATVALSELLTFGTPPLYGIALMLAGCMAYRKGQ